MRASCKNKIISSSAFICLRYLEFNFVINFDLPVSIKIYALLIMFLLILVLLSDLDIKKYNISPSKKLLPSSKFKTKKGIAKVTHVALMGGLFQLFHDWKIKSNKTFVQN